MALDALNLYSSLELYTHNQACNEYLYAFYEALGEDERRMSRDYDTIAHNNISDV